MYQTRRNWGSMLAMSLLSALGGPLLYDDRPEVPVRRRSKAWKPPEPDHQLHLRKAELKRQRKAAKHTGR